MIIILAVTWLLVSIGAVYVDDRYHRWPHLFKIFAGFTILAFLFNVGVLYDPNLNRMIGGVIETNPTWNLAIIISIAEGICLTGPIALIHTLYEKHKYKR